MVKKMLHEEGDEEDEEPILGLDSEISNADDLDYVPQDQAGVVGVSLNPALGNEGSFDDEGDSSDESFEEETQTQSNRLSKNGSYWIENPSI